MKHMALLLVLILSVAGCETSRNAPIEPVFMVDGIKATAVKKGDEAVVTLDTKNPTDWDGQSKMIQRALTAAGVLTGCYSSPKPSKELDAYVAGAEPVRIAVDLQC